LREQKIGGQSDRRISGEKLPKSSHLAAWDISVRRREFAHLVSSEHDPARSKIPIEIRTRSYELFAQLRLDGKPALILQASRNWDFPLSAAAHGWTAILYRRPNRAPIASSRICAPLKMAR